MLPSRRFRRLRGLDFWPGFVDALAALLLLLVFVLSFFTLFNFFMSQEISGQDTVLQRLQREIAQLTEALTLEKTAKADLSSSFEDLQQQTHLLAKKNGLLSEQIAHFQSAQSQASEGDSQVSDSPKIPTEAETQIALLNQQLGLLRQQIATLETALEISQRQNAQSETRMADLGRKLNMALARRVQELSRYRSDFFGRLRQILADHPEMRIVGDRFVFQSEVFFDTGSAELRPSGKIELKKVARAIQELERTIPSEIDWIVRVDGHTDKRPIVSPDLPFRDNWELSVARALSVVHFFIEEGVMPAHLAAAGFGAFRPLEEGNTEQAYARNRRIELKLTE